MAIQKETEMAKRRLVTWTDVLFFVIATIVIGGGGLGYAEWRYGDWTCAFQRCVLAENVK